MSSHHGHNNAQNYQDSFHSNRNLHIDFTIVNVLAGITANG
jgi:hypothetical protein